MSKDFTVLYYSANTENEKFESIVRQNILKQKESLPLVSVTQKPLENFGLNICVGKQYNCYGNEFRQIQIGLNEVQTEYVLVTEADVLYPPQYFQFTPQDADYYRYANVWVNYVLDINKKNKAYFKLYSDGAQMVKVSFWKNLINKTIGNDPYWFSKENICPKLYRLETDPRYTWTSENPVITFKTTNGVSRYTSIRKDFPPQAVLPFWGDINKLKRKLFL